MAVRENRSSIEHVVGLCQTFGGDATFFGASIDMRGFQNAISLTEQMVTYTAGTITTTMQESDVGGAGPWTDVAAADLFGAFVGLTGTIISGGLMNDVAYMGTKRYLRVKAQATGGGAGIYCSEFHRETEVAPVDGV